MLILKELSDSLSRSDQMASVPIYHDLGCPRPSIVV